MTKSQVISGRYTADMEGPFVVFIIGMRINRWLRFYKWIPVARAMVPMIKELYQHSELGFIHAEMYWSGRGTTLVQYWRSYEQLEQYACGGIHLQAWKKFNPSVGTDGTVGIYHETYMIQPGQ